MALVQMALVHMAEQLIGRGQMHMRYKQGLGCVDGCKGAGDNLTACLSMQSVARLTLHTLARLLGEGTPDIASHSQHTFVSV